MCIGNPGDFLNIRSHQRSPQRAVQPDRQGTGMADGIPESRHCLSRQDTSGRICHSTGNHDGQFFAGLFEERIDCEKSCFAVQGIENRFDQQQIGTSFNQSPYLFQIGLDQLVESHIAGTRVSHVWRDRSGSGSRPDRTCHETGVIRR